MVLGPERSLELPKGRGADASSLMFSEVAERANTDEGKKNELNKI